MPFPPCRVPARIELGAPLQPSTMPPAPAPAATPETGRMLLQRIPHLAGGASRASRSSSALFFLVGGLLSCRHHSYSLLAILTCTYQQLGSPKHEEGGSPEDIARLPGRISTALAMTETAYVEAERSATCGRSQRDRRGGYPLPPIGAVPRRVMQIYFGGLAFYANG